MCGSIVDVQSAAAEIRRGKKKIEPHDIMPASATQGGHTQSSFCSRHTSVTSTNTESHAAIAFSLAGLLQVPK